MRKGHIHCILIMVIAVLVGMANAVPIYSGIYLGTFGGNDNVLQDVQNSINQSAAYTDPDVSLSLYGKVDAPSTLNGGITIVYPTYYNGTWNTANPINFYSVKGGNEHAIYWMATPATTGNWTTYHLRNQGGNQPEISHLTAFIGEGSDDPNSTIPEPATLSLLGIGLLSFAAFTRRKKK